MNTIPAYTRRRSIVSSCPRCPFKAVTTQKDERPRRSTTSNLPSSHEHSRTMNKTIDYSEWDKAMNIYCNAREDEKIPTPTTPKQHCLDVVVDKRLPSRRRSSVTALTLSMSTESSIETSVLLEARQVATSEEEENGYYIYTCDDDSCISSLQDSIYPKKKDDEEDEDLDWERLESFMDNDFLNDDNIEECYDALVHLHKVYKEKNEKKNKTSMKSSAALQRRPVFTSPQVEQYRVGRRCPAA